MNSGVSNVRFVGGIVTVAALALLAWGVGRWAGQNSISHPRPTTPAATAIARPHATEPADMAARLERARAQPGGLARRLALMKLADQATDHDLPDLLTSGTLSAEDLFRLVRHWADRDPAGCWAWHEREGAAAVRGYGVINLIFAAWARQDPAAAMDALRAATWESQSSAADGILEVWLLDENKSAEALAPYLDDLARLASTPRRWAALEDPERLGARLLALPSGTARTDFIRKFGAGFFEKDWAAAVAWTSSMPEPDRSALLAQSAATALNTRMQNRSLGNAAADPRHAERLAWAQQWLATEADTTTRARLGPLYVESLAATDPAAALVWAQESLGGWTLSQAIGKIVESQAGADREGTLALIDSLPPGGVRTKATDAFVAQWHNQDPAAATAWALAQSRDTLSDQGWGNLGSKWAFADPDGFKAAIQAPSGEVPPQMVGSGVRNLVRKDAPGTASWASSLPPTLRERTLSSTMHTWAGEDAPAAAKFIADNPSIPIPDGAAIRVAELFHSRDPEAAVTWTRALPVGPTRDSARTAVKAAIEKLNDAATRARLLRSLE